MTNSFATLIKLATTEIVLVERNRAHRGSIASTTPREIRQSIQICVIGPIMVIDSRSRNSLFYILRIETCWILEIRLMNFTEKFNVVIGTYS